MCIRYTAARLEVARAVRSMHSLGRRTLAAGATSALALTLFNAVQPSLGTHHRIGPGTVKDVAVTLVPTASPKPASPEAAPTGAVDNAASPSAESATLPLRGAEPGPGLMKAASAAGDATGAGSVKPVPAAGGGASGAGRSRVLRRRGRSC